MGECGTRLFGGIMIKAIFPYESCLETIIILESPSCDDAIGTEMTHFTSTAIIQASRRSSVCGQQDRFLWFWEEGRTSWPCCSRLKMLSVSLSLVLHQGSLLPSCSIPLISREPDHLHQSPQWKDKHMVHRTGTRCIIISNSLSLCSRESAMHPPLLKRTPLHRSNTLTAPCTLSLVCERDVCFHKYLTASPCLSLSSLTSLWRMSRIGTGSEGWAGKRWPLMGRVLLFHMHVCVCWRPDKISFVNRNQFHT